jgi:nitrogen regulatory protein P-II 1
MKLIKAMIRPSKLDSVRDGLLEVGVDGFTIIEAVGVGRGKWTDEAFATEECIENLTPCVLLEIFMEDHLLETITQVIQKAAKTGDAGDGHILVLPIDEIINIRTGEKYGNASAKTA